MAAAPRIHPSKRRRCLPTCSAAARLSGVQAPRSGPHNRSDAAKSSSPSVCRAMSAGHEWCERQAVERALGSKHAGSTGKHTPETVPGTGTQRCRPATSHAAATISPSGLRQGCDRLHVPSKPQRRLCRPANRTCGQDDADDEAPQEAVVFLPHPAGNRAKLESLWACQQLGSLPWSATLITPTCKGQYCKEADKFSWAVPGQLRAHLARRFGVNGPPRCSTRALEPAAGHAPGQHTSVLPVTTHAPAQSHKKRRTATGSCSPSWPAA